MATTGSPAGLRAIHGTPESWNEACHRVYGYDTVDALEKAWLDALHNPPSRIAARESLARSGYEQHAEGGKPGQLHQRRLEWRADKLRTSAAPSAPLLEPPVKAIRAAAPEYEPRRVEARPASLDRPPPVLLPPEIPRPVRP